MKSRIIAFHLLALVFSACKNASEKKVLTQETKKIDDPTTCYTYAQNNDYVAMRITIADNLVSGGLSYKYFEKDKNIGKIKGQISGDTLFAEYTFMSEGVNSTREVSFLKSGNEWREGYGEVAEQSGKMVFANKGKLNYSSKTPLKNSECLTNEEVVVLAANNFYSSIKNKTVLLSENAIKLKPIDSKDNSTKPAYLIFSDGKTTAEIFLPTTANSMLLTRTGVEGNYKWSSGEFELLIWKGYVLKNNKVAIFGGG